MKTGIVYSESKGQFTFDRTLKGNEVSITPNIEYQSGAIFIRMIRKKYKTIGEEKGPFPKSHVMKSEFISYCANSAKIEVGSEYLDPGTITIEISGEEELLVYGRESNGDKIDKRIDLEIVSPLERNKVICMEIAPFLRRFQEITIKLIPS